MYRKYYFLLPSSTSMSQQHTVPHSKLDPSIHFFIFLSLIPMLQKFSLILRCCWAISETNVWLNPSAEVQHQLNFSPSVMGSPEQRRLTNSLQYLPLIANQWQLMLTYVLTNHSSVWWLQWSKSLCCYTDKPKPTVHIKTVEFSKAKLQHKWQDQQ